MRSPNIISACLAIAATAGCASIGPASVPRDRFDYVATISDSWKRQMLQNLLKVRYNDAPVFLDVTSVVNSYTLDREVAVGGQLAPVGRGDTFGAATGNLGYSDRPTITYTPLAGEKFARSLMTPLPVSALLNLVQSGYPADLVLRIGAISIGGLDNAYGGRLAGHPGDPRFAELLTALREAQQARVIGVRERSVPERNAGVLYFRNTNEGAAALAAIRRLLALDPAVLEYDVVYGPFATRNTQIAILSRSTLQVMTDFASYVDVSAAEIAEGRVYAPARTADELARFPPLIRVRTGETAPPDAHVGVRYRDRWFWIDDQDVESKAALGALMLLFSLADTDLAQGARPVLTIPTR